VEEKATSCWRSEPSTSVVEGEWTRPAPASARQGGEGRTWHRSRRAPSRTSDLADAEQTRNRTEILNQLFRGMLLLNGGACLALLAFVQAIWDRATASFVRAVVWAWLSFWRDWCSPL
jgi:hypothetical protein